MLDTAGFDGATELLAQIPHAEVVAEDVTWLDLRVPDSVQASPFRKGPVPVKAYVGESGELLLWVKDGRLSAIEYAWTTDDKPTEFPPPDDVHVDAEL
jgi:hypothetical protein